MIDKLDKKALDRSLYLYLGISIFLFILFTLFQINITSLIKENPQQVIKLNSFSSSQKENGTKYVRLKKGDPNIYEFQTSIAKERFNNLAGRNYELLVYQFASQWYKIYFNGFLIGGSGNYQSNNSNIWNEFDKYPIPKRVIKENNEIKIKAYGAYEIGTLTLPIIISYSKFTNVIYDWFNLFFDSFYMVVLGVILINLLFLGYIVNLNPTVKNEYIYYIFANLFLIPAIFDYLTIHNLPISLLLFKKIIIATNCIVVSFVSYGLYRKFKQKINLIVGALLLIVLSIGLILFSNIITFINYWGIINAVILLNLVAWLYTTIINLKESYIAKVMFVTSLFALYDPINVVFLSYFDINLGINANRFLVFPLAFVLVTLYHYMELDRTISYEQAKSELMYQKAIKDEMTDTYNHQYIVNFLDNKEGKYSIIMLDIDDFKNINDQYGHQTGDFVIKYVVQEIKSNIRKDDVVGRYGGDEFIIILDECPKENAKQIANSIKEDIKQSHKTPQGETVKVTVSVGVHYVQEKKARKEILHKVDQNLYKAKNRGKDIIVVG